MFYMIDNDKLKPVAKSEKGDDLKKFVETNGLELAYTIISNEDELVAAFTLEELNVLCNTVDDFGVDDYQHENEASDFIYEVLTKQGYIYPTFNKALGKKLAAADVRDPPAPVEKPAKPTAPTKVKPPAKQSSRVKLNSSDSLVMLTNTCKAGSVLATIATAINEEMLTTVGEVTEYITSNHKLPNGQSPDEAYAVQKIKDLIGMEKIGYDEL